jgi:dienelactone hydrolase
MPNWLRKTLLVLLGLVLVAVIAFLVWALLISPPMPEATAALQSDADVTVVDADGRISFTPNAVAPQCGLFFYPGGRVNPQSYAPTLRAIAAAGYQVVTESMPLNLAILDINAAAGGTAAFPDIARWAVGGHSLGGSVATFYAHDNPAAVAGVALWAAYATESRSLADRDDLSVVSISGSLDGLATPETIDAARGFLPADTTFVEIEGGNHAQFGWYGDQRGDNPATISREEQTAATVAATVAMLEEMCGE